MFERNDFTKDSKHIDYICYYEEMTEKDYNTIINSVKNFRESKKVKAGSREYETKTGKTRNKPLYTYSDLCCAFDIETSTVYAPNIYTGISDYYSAMYVAQFAINNYGIRFRFWKDVRKFFIDFPKRLKLSKSEVLLTYVHNLDYETSYIKHRFNIDSKTFFGKSRQRPIKYLCEQHIFMHDSYIMTNMSLEKLAQTYNTLHQKTKQDIDHTKVRNCYSKITKKEERYIFNDVFILTDFAAKIFEMYDYIPDTSTQVLNKKVQKYAAEDSSDLVGVETFERWKNDADTDYDILKKIHGYIFGYDYTVCDCKHHVSGLVDSDMFTPYSSLGVPPPPEGLQDGNKIIYDFYEWLYRGGIAKSNIRYTSYDTYLQHGVQQRVGGYDYTSSYPFVMTAFNFPMGKFKEFNCDIDTLELEYDKPDFENYRYIFIIRFTDIETIDDYCIESVSKIKGKNIVEDNGRLYSADEITACLTDCDYALYKKFYKWKNKEVIKVWRSKAGKLPNYLLQPMWDAGEKKQSLKHVAGMETEYMLNKINFNLFYGLCCKQPVYNNYSFDNVVISENEYVSSEIDKQQFFGSQHTIKHTVENDVEEFEELPKEDIERKTFIESVQGFILSPFWGIWTSAFARFNLLNVIYEVSKDSEWITNDTIYCDTDSLYFINPEKHIHIIISWNEWVKDRVLSKLPEKYHKSLGTLGQFDNIALDETNGYSDTFINFKTLGSKRYIKEFQLPKKKVIKATIAGLPKKSLENFCKRNKLCIYETFDNLMDFTIDSQDLSKQDKVKLGRKYHDERVKFFCDGIFMEEFSSCTLYSTTFTLKMNKLYLLHMATVHENIRGGKNAKDIIY